MYSQREVLPRVCAYKIGNSLSILVRGPIGIQPEILDMWVRKICNISALIQAGRRRFYAIESPRRSTDNVTRKSCQPGPRRQSITCRKFPSWKQLANSHASWWLGDAPPHCGIVLDSYMNRSMEKCDDISESNRISAEVAENIR